MFRNGAALQAPVVDDPDLPALLDDEQPRCRPAAGSRRPGWRRPREDQCRLGRPRRRRDGGEAAQQGRSQAAKPRRRARAPEHARLMHRLAGRPRPRCRASASVIGWRPRNAARWSSRWSATCARSARRAAPSCTARAGTRRRRCGCSATTSTPRWPRIRPGWSSTAARARRRATTRRCGRSSPRCSTWSDDETLLVQSGKPVAVFRTHPGAPRVLIANSLLVPRFATWDEFRRLEAEGLTMFGQMTAGSWIYIGTQGILQGTFQTFAAAGEKHWGSPDLAGPHDPHRGPGRDGRRAAAGGLAGRRRQPQRRGRPAPDRAAAGDALPGRGGRRPRRRRCAACAPAPPRARASRSACWATPATSSPSSPAAGCSSTSSPTRRRRTTC